MLFNSYEFLFAFFPISLAVFFYASALAHDWNTLRFLVCRFFSMLVGCPFPAAPAIVDNVNYIFGTIIASQSATDGSARRDGGWPRRSRSIWGFSGFSNMHILPLRTSMPRSERISLSAASFCRWEFRSSPSSRSAFWSMSGAGRRALSFCALRLVRVVLPAAGCRTDHPL